MRLLCALAVLGAALAVPPAAAQRRDTGFDLVRLDPSARAAALAGAAGALPAEGDPTALFYNPALLADDMHRALAVGVLNHLSDVSAGTVVYARDVARLGATVGVGLRLLSYGSFDEATPEGPTGNTFRAGETALTLSAARAVAPRVRAGASVHLLSARVADAGALALTADAGATYEVPSQQLVLAASLHHVGRTFSSLGGTPDRLPTDLRLTVSKRLRYLPLTVSLSGYDLAGFESAATADSSAVQRALDHVAAGGELRLGRALAVRAGYHPRRGADLRSGDRLDLAGVSAGFGLRLARIGLDYAYNGWSQYGGLHQFGLRTRL